MSTFPFVNLSDAPGAIKVKDGAAEAKPNQRIAHPVTVTVMSLSLLAFTLFCLVALMGGLEEGAPTGVFLTVAGIILTLGALIEERGVTHYLCTMDSGKLYWSEKDPRSMRDCGWGISGNVIRVRNGGLTFKALYYLTHFRPYNCVFTPGDPRPFMFLTFNSSVYEATLCQGKMRYGSFSADRFLQIPDLPRFFAQRDDNEFKLRQLQAGVRVVHHYLDEVPDRTKRSKPGQWVSTALKAVAFLTNMSLELEQTPEMQRVQSGIRQATEIGIVS